MIQSRAAPTLKAQAVKTPICAVMYTREVRGKEALGRKEHESVRLASLLKGTANENSARGRKKKTHTRKKEKEKPANTLLQLCLPELERQEGGSSSVVLPF